jgi:hypothetical protein
MRQTIVVVDTECFYQTATAGKMVKLFALKESSTVVRDATAVL